MNDSSLSTALHEIQCNVAWDIVRLAPVGELFQSYASVDLRLDVVRADRIQELIVFV